MRAIFRTRRRDLECALAAVIQAIEYYASLPGGCYAKNKTIAALAGYCERHFQRLKAIAIERGMLEQMRRFTRNAREWAREITSTHRVLEPGEASYTYAKSYLNANPDIYIKKRLGKSAKQPRRAVYLTTAMRDEWIAMNIAAGVPWDTGWRGC